MSAHAAFVFVLIGFVALIPWRVFCWIQVETWEGGEIVSSAELWLILLTALRSSSRWCPLVSQL